VRYQFLHITLHSVVGRSVVRLIQVARHIA